MSAERRRRRAQRTGLDPDLRRRIDSLTRDPSLRVAMYEAIGAVDTRDALEAYACSGSFQKGAILLAMRDALIALTERKPCDLCPAVARRIRFVIVWPGEDFRGVQQHGGSNALTGFATLCDRCARMDSGELKRRMLDRYAALQADVGPEPYRREAIFGAGVGEVVHLAPGHSLEECSDCRRPLWIDPELITGPADEAAFLCRACAEKAAAAGRLESVPVSVS